jgi:hypothetical protein
LMGTDRQPRPHAQHRRLPRLERSRPLPEIPRTFIARPQGVVRCLAPFPGVERDPRQTDAGRIP